MLYRTFGKLDWKVSALGFGAMRLPILHGDPGQVDVDHATRMVRYAIDHGVNYVDTAYPYHAGTGEGIVGAALQDGYRERVRLATKLPSWLVEEAGDFDRFLDEQLARLQTGYVDFYLLHGLNSLRWPKMRELDVFRWAERAMADGRIGYLGFSYHDSYPLFQEIVDAYDGWALCQIQYNYMDEEYQAGTRGLHYAAGKGLAVVVMEPVRGGQLAKVVPPAVQALWDGAPQRRTPAEWALRWVWSHPEVAVVLSGMSALPQVEENVAVAERWAAEPLTAEEIALVERVRDAYRELCPIPCTTCGYCMPCPTGVNIPRVFEIYNDFAIYSDPARAQLLYSWLTEGERAGACIECGECLEKCPQGIDIPEWMKRVHDRLGRSTA